MSISGSGVGGTPGGPQQPTIFELQQRGIEDTQKAQLAIVKDTVEVPLTQLGGGSDEVYERYKSSSSQPVLAPLVQFRMASSSDKSESLDTTEILQNLISRLPEAIISGLAINQARLPLEQNLSLVALDNVLTSVALTLAFIESAAQLPATGSLEADRLEIAQTAPYQAVLAALALNDNLSSSLNNVLSAVGPNDPNFDTVQNALAEIKTFSSALTILSQQQTVYAGDLVQISAGLQDIKDSLQRDLRDNSYQILGDSINALSTVVMAYSLGEVSPSNLLSLAILQNGISGDNGVYSNNFASLIDNTASGLQTILNLDNTSQINSLELLLSTVALASILGGTALGNGIGQFPDQAVGDVNEASRFSTDLAVGLIAGSGVIETVVGDLISATGINQNAVTPLTSAFTLWSLILGTQAAATMGQSRASELLETLQPQLLTHLNTLDQYITSQQENGALPRGVGQGALVYLSQANIALQNQDYDEFLRSLGSLMQLAGQTEDNVKKDMSSITEFGSLAGSALAGELDDQLANFTGFSQA